MVDLAPGNPMWSFGSMAQQTFCAYGAESSRCFPSKREALGVLMDTQRRIRFAFDGD
jgi:hypothetical protein